jgi:ClpP class serine protease
MEHMAETLRAADRALCTAYTAKTGMTEEEALEMMEHETWLTAQQAKEKGLIDEVMFEEPEEEIPMINGNLFKLPTADQMERAKQMMSVQQAEENQPSKEEMEAFSFELELLN